ncbi:MAG: Phosphate starvation-inducible protein PhoH, predicted ATPase [Acidobacteria bacterium]|nr:Phosphate starvation-inducible protein PhoH, predicted ATPase [Acidobacteriota bacterium]
MSNLKKIELPPQGLKTLFGVRDQNIKYLETLLDVNIGARGNEILVDGDPNDIRTVEQILTDFAELFEEGNTFSDKELRDAFKQIAEDRAYSLKDYFTKSRFNPSGKKQVAPKTANQRKYIEAMTKNDLTFGIGPAGTGKSFLAVAMAVNALFQKQVSRIILTRPAVEAGERLGFLPGDLQDKVDPYLRPLYDALFDLVDNERVTKMLEKRIIEIAPLAFMRGRTLSDAFIILDEAQNTTGEQMKMFLTRIGFGSKAVVTGDKTQIDLPRGQKSGLKEAEMILSDIEGIEFIQFNDRDVVRHKLVQMIVRAYESHTEKTENENEYRRGQNS